MMHFELINLQKKRFCCGIHEMNIVNERSYHKYNLGLEVLNDAWCLAKCDYLLCGHSI